MELPKVTDVEGNEIAVHHNPYLSLHSLLKTMKGELVVLESGEQCVRLGANRPAALRNLWVLFPEMRAHIARWLLTVCDTFQYRTNFDSAQITAAFVNILKLDFTAGVNQFFSRLYAKPDHCMLLGFIGLELYNDLQYRDKILPYIYKWADASGSWLWKSAVYVYAYIKSDEEIDGLAKKMRRVLMNQCGQLEHDDLRTENVPYVGMLMMVSERLRSLVASVLRELVNKTHKYHKKSLICFRYTELIRYAYYAVSPQMTALPLVACDTKQQLLDLLPVLETALLRYDTRQSLFITLKPYLREISRYDVDKKTENHIKAFFQLISESDPRFRQDIALFLKNCDCRMAKELRGFLMKTLK